jgi:CubicO group peptidase (beta-lactamase class C family)
MSPRVQINGFVADGFGAVGDALVRCVKDHGDVGAAAAVYHHGRPVVDIWTGWADAARSRPWDRDTVVTTFSTTKGVTAVCANLLVQRGLLDPTRPVAHYWPEFAANGKAAITVEMVLSHQAGLAAVDGDLTLDDIVGWHGVVDAIAAQAPQWEPGSAYGYHARSFGWITGEIIRRVTGRRPGAFLAEEIAGPLGLRFWIGLPEDIEPSCAELIPSPGPSFLSMLDRDSLMYRVMAGPSDLFAGGYDESWNARPLHAAEMPSSNGIGDARSLARLYAACIGDVDGTRLLTDGTLDEATRLRTSGPDLVIGQELCFGLGFIAGPTVLGLGRPRAFGHSGAGGSVAMADRDAGLAVAYVMNRLRFDADPRAASVAAAALGCV